MIILTKASFNFVKCMHEKQRQYEHKDIAAVFPCLLVSRLMKKCLLVSTNSFPTYINQFFFWINGLKQMSVDLWIH